MRTLTGPLRRLDAVAYSPDGAELVAVGGYDPGRMGNHLPDRGVTVWQLGGDPAAPRHLFPDRTAADAVYTPDGRWLLVPLVMRQLGTTGDLGLFAVDRAADTEPTRTLAPHFRAVAVGNRVLSAGPSTDAELAPPWELRLSAAAPRGGFRTVWRHPYPAGVWGNFPAVVAGGMVAVVETTHNPRGPNVHALVLRSARAGELVGETPLPGRTAVTLTAAPDGKRLVGNAGGSLYVWRPTDLDAAPRKITFGKKHCTGVAFLPDGRTVLAAGNDGRVRRLDLDTGATTGSYSWKAGKARSVAVAPDGLTAAVGTDRGTVILFDLD